MQHVDKRLFLALDSVDIDRRDAAGDLVTAHREQYILHKEGFGRLGNGSELPSYRMLTVYGGAYDSNISEYVHSGTHKVFFFCVSAN